MLDLSFCAMKPGSPIWAEIEVSLRFALAAVMFLLVAAQFVRESSQMYKGMKQWQLGRLMKLFAREGLLYFLAYVYISSFLFQQRSRSIPVVQHPLFHSHQHPGSRGRPPPLPVWILEYAPVITLTPRFILSLRALHACGLRGGVDCAI
ncbi:hypothetical protein HD554DRAFT_930186 [Boletus coccyginus]|nr:hypothetical protein HD554DRAFT_930186 [Boletus coccyginus]